jgi:hypothetical protein
MRYLVKLDMPTESTESSYSSYFWRESVKKMIPLLLALVVFAVGCAPGSPINIGAPVQQPVINSFSASPPSISVGGSSTLSWTVTGATTVSIDQGIGNVALTATRAVSPSATTIYTLIATNSAGSVTVTAQVVVSGTATPTPMPPTRPVTIPTPVPTPMGLPVINYLRCEPPLIYRGSTATLSWSVSNATSIIINPGIGAVSPAGSRAVSPAATTTYTITATNSNGSRSSALTLTVLSLQ